MEPSGASESWGRVHPSEEPLCCTSSQMMNCSFTNTNYITFKTLELTITPAPGIPPFFFSYNVVELTMTHLQNIDAAELKIRSFFLHTFFPPCRKCTLPIMQINRRRFSQRFGCVILVAANVALSQ